jgi:hypothetical protein
MRSCLRIVRDALGILRVVHSEQTMHQDWVSALNDQKLPAQTRFLKCYLLPSVQLRVQAGLYKRLRWYPGSTTPATFQN